jgi:hypothetical protein
MTVTYFQTDSQKEKNAMELSYRFSFVLLAYQVMVKDSPDFNAIIKHHDSVFLTSFNLRDWIMTVLVLLIWEQH